MTSSFANEEQIKADLTASGLSPEGDRKPVPVPPAEPKTASAPPEKPGESSGAAPAGESAPAPEAGEKTAQGETPAGVEGKGTEPAAATPPSGERPLRRDNFKSKIEKLEARETRLLDELELERGSKTKLQGELEELRAELAKLKPPEAEPAQDAGPVRPKRPTLADCDFDQTKLDEAMDVYDSKMDDYHAAMEERRATEREAKRVEEQQKQAQLAEAEKVHNAFVERKDGDRNSIEDWDEVFEQLDQLTGGEDVAFPQAVNLAIVESDHPGLLLYHFAKDAMDGQKDLRRIAALSPVRQAWAIKELEAKLAGEHAPKGTTPAAASVTPPAKPTPAATPSPAPRRPAARIEEPIEPVGSRATANGPGLEGATNAKDYIRLRYQGVNR